MSVEQKLCTRNAIFLTSAKSSAHKMGFSCAENLHDNCSRVLWGLISSFPTTK